MKPLDLQRFVEAATHELHTPLTAILGYQELLADGIYGPLEPGAEDAVIRIGRSAHYLMSLIDGLLDTILAESGELVLEPDDVLLTQLLTDCVESTSPLATDRGVALELELPDDLAVIRSDPVRLRRCVELAIVAAIRYAEDRATLRLAAQSGPDLRLAIGPTAVTDAMLHPDHTVRASSDRLSLRLAVAQRLARALGGDLLLESSEAELATLHVRVPPLPAD